MATRRKPAKPKRKPTKPKSTDIIQRPFNQYRDYIKPVLDGKWKSADVPPELKGLFTLNAPNDRRSKIKFLINQLAEFEQNPFIQRQSPDTAVLIESELKRQRALLELEQTKKQDPDEAWRQEIREAYDYLWQVNKSKPSQVEVGEYLNIPESTFKRHCEKHGIMSLRTFTKGFTNRSKG